MNPEEQAYRDAWISELWRPVPEYREHKPKPDVKTPARRKPCPICGAEMAASNLARHVNNRHSSAVEKVA